jgi:hypothetical protein
MLQLADRVFQLGLHLKLHPGVEGGEDLQAVAFQIRFLIFGGQLLTDQIEKGRKAVESSLAAGQIKKGLGHGGLEGGLVDQATLAHHRQNQLATLQTIFRVTPGVVEAWPLDHPYQRGDLGGSEVIEVALEIVLAGQGKAVDCPVALLAEIDFVDIGGEDLLLAVVPVKNHRHDRFLALAGQGSFRAEEEVFHQLLGDGAPPLHRFAGAEVGDQRPENCQGRDTVVFMEASILNGEEGVGEKCGDLF